MSNQVNSMPMVAHDVDGSGQFDQVQAVSLDIDSHHGDTHSEVSFHDINYTVQIPQNFFGKCRATTPKKILTDVR